MKWVSQSEFRIVFLSEPSVEMVCCESDVKYTPTELKGTHQTNAVAGVLQSLFIGNKLSFL